MGKYRFWLNCSVSQSKMQSKEFRCSLLRPVRLNSEELRWKPVGGSTMEAGESFRIDVYRYFYTILHDNQSQETNIKQYLLLIVHSLQISPSDNVRRKISHMVTLYFPSSQRSFLPSFPFCFL
jgi:hypothetical protein